MAVSKEMAFFIKIHFEAKGNEIIFALPGGLAQLARALAWHARGRRFDPDTLHFIMHPIFGCILFCIKLSWQNVPQAGGKVVGSTPILSTL